ncbi:MAG: hypothetical protein SGI83_06675 [Bacteroidota bacterium]|nr:hypothetical protein [Bacteroidota bacterium]
MKILSFIPVGYICVLLLYSCGNKSENKAAEVQEPAKSMNDTGGENNSAAGASFLSANELLRVADYSDLAGIQKYMKDKSGSFVHGKKGEFATFSTTALVDTAGRQIELISSTLYVSTDPMEDWRVAHTIHAEALSDQLMEDFRSKKFLLIDSAYNSGMKATRYDFESVDFPGKILYYCKTFLPWPSKGIYVNRATWPCFVYEVYKAN